MSIYFWRIRFIPVMVSCSVTEYASSASSLTEYSSRHVLTRYRPSLSRTGHSFYRQILNTESPPALPADIQLQGQLINTWFPHADGLITKTRWMADDKHPGYQYKALSIMLPSAHPFLADEEVLPA